ncbi:hypothetical protein [Aquabacter spiritensis]|uniref:Uncharacterized protein n=1 Tax=Aquabacter spiritensis TaxID=933073 RepID=A0A4R3LWT2_9HYPH|nr:hypothetical protein [Aquabacter spiritensis]TCT05033.1 hypothetical protein EDC64_10564 [Aquabacter spiritensis]
MLICVLGSQSPFAVLGVHIVRTIAAFVLNDFHYVHATTMAQLNEAWQSRNDRPVVLYSDYLEPRLVDILVKSGAPMVWFLDDLQDCALYCAKARDVELRLGVVFTIQSLCSFARFIPQPFITRLWRPGPRATLGPLVRKIAEGYQLDATDDLVARVCQHLTGGAEEAEAALVEDQIRKIVATALPIGAHASLPRSEQMMLKDVLGGYSALFGDHPTKFRWPVSFFISGSPPHAPVLGPIDMTGPARCLLFGPQLSLPEGRWVAHAAFAVSENYSGNILKVDVVSAGKVAAEAVGDLPADGRFAVSIPFENVSNMFPVDLRIMMMSGAIEGTFELLHAWLEPLALADPAHAEPPQPVRSRRPRRRADGRRF